MTTRSSILWGSGQSWARAQVGLGAELGVGLGGRQDCGTWGRAGRRPGGPQDRGARGSAGRGPGGLTLVTVAPLPASTIAQSEVLGSRPSSISGDLSSLQTPPRPSRRACSEGGSEGPFL